MSKHTDITQKIIQAFYAVYNQLGFGEVDPIVKTVIESKDKSRTPFLNEAF